MVTACQQASIGIFVVSAKGDEYKKSLLDDHALIMKTFGIKDVIVLVNKIDVAE